MKHVLIILTALCFLLNACTKVNTNDTSNGTNLSAIDTVKAAAIDTLVTRINHQWKDGPNFHTVYANQRDTIKYIELNGEPQRISSMFFTDTTLTWVTFHQVNNELILVRLREKRDLSKSSVKECLSYLENGKIFYSKERSKILETGEGAGAFRTLPFVENARTPEQLEAEYTPYWKITKKAIDDARKKQ